MSDVPLAEWLAENNLSAYLDAFEADGYDVQVLSKMNEEELSEVMDDVEMKKGHRRKLPLALEQVREHDAKKKAAAEAESDLKTELHKELRALEAKDRVASKKAELLKQNQPAQQRSVPVPVPAKRESKGADLPVGKEYAAFISHKKVCSVFVKRRILSVFFRFMYQHLCFLLL